MWKDANANPANLAKREAFPIPTFAELAGLAFAFEVFALFFAIEHSPETPTPWLSPLHTLIAPSCLDRNPSMLRTKRTGIRKETGSFPVPAPFPP